MNCKVMTIGTILLFMGASIPYFGIPTQSASLNYKELIVWCTFIVGRIKNPYYHDNFYFQVVNVTVLGLFYKDLANPYFGVYRLNESWMVQDAQYLGINHIRIVLNQSGVTHVFGILMNGDICYKNRIRGEKI
jgi:hypothetical protein